jgi:hypothetical protein
MRHKHIRGARLLAIACLFAVLPGYADSFHASGKEIYKRLEILDTDVRRALESISTMAEKINVAGAIQRSASNSTIDLFPEPDLCRGMYRIEIETENNFHKALTTDRHLLQSAVTPDDACALFGQGYGATYWDDAKSKPREFPDGCGMQDVGILFEQGRATQDLLKKACSLTGPTSSISCGENGFLAYLDKFATPLMGLITDKCRYPCIDDT